MPVNFLPLPSWEEPEGHGSLSSAPPSLLTLMNCGTPSNNVYSMGCVATGFLPSSLTFKWTDDSGSPGGAYTGVSQLRVAKNVWDTATSFKCSVEHPGGEKTAVINKPVEAIGTAILLPYMGIFIREGFQMRQCVKTTFSRTEIPRVFACHIHSVILTDKMLTLLETSECFLSNGTKYVSLLKVKNTDWNNKVKYICVVQHQEQTITKTISKTEPLMVTLNPPRVKEVFLYNQAVLDCVISGTDQDTVSGTNITWHVNGQEQTDHIDLKPIESKGNLNIRVSTLTIDQTEWTNVNKVQCSALKSGEVTSVIQDLSFTKGSRSLRHLNVVVINGHILQVLEREAQDVQTFAPAQQNILLTEPEAGFALSCTDNDEDEFSSLWSTTSSFIILFLLSLTYSTVLSLVKVLTLLI
uniref:Ig-like domain-containing protein n=1 Tax=Hucho hucho TaxID=62062 RepID=A0A4W5MM34_9TELE